MIIAIIILLAVVIFLPILIATVDLGGLLIEGLGPILESLEPLIPGEWFPLYFTRVYLQRPLIASLIVSMVAGFMGTFLLMRNLALIGDGLAHVSFGAIAVALAVGWAPLKFALIICVISALVIEFLSEKGYLTGDSAIAIFLTGMLGLGLVVSYVSGDSAIRQIDGYLWGNLNLIDAESFNNIVWVSLISYITLVILYRSLLAICIDRIASQVQGIPVFLITTLWSMLIAVVVVSMVQIVGALLVTALIVTPAATAQLTSRSFFMCVVLSQIFGIITVLLGLYYSAELGTGSGSMIALVSAVLFVIIALTKGVMKILTATNQNTN